MFGIPLLLSVTQVVFESYDSGLFTPLESLSALSESSFTTLEHPLFPRYGIRIKKTSFCDETVNAYTGYLDITGARHLFFYFFESRSDPSTDDVIFWTNGGPGCSSSLGLFMELGPCRILDAEGPKHHLESWNTNANIFFIDQPIGTGFSYADYGEKVSTTEEAAVDIAAFVAIFFAHFSQFQGRPFHMAGESYAGRYLPEFAAQVYDQNAQLIQAGIPPINLTSVMIGNGLSDLYSMIPSYWDMTCTAASIPPILDIATCVRMRTMIPRCETWMKDACLNKFDSVECAAAVGVCGDVFSRMNPYDISRECEGGLSESLCYPVTKVISSFLDRSDIRAQLGVDPAVSTNFTSCSAKVATAFGTTLDSFYPSTGHIEALLERGVHILLYVGSYDWICNWVGNDRMARALQWSGQAAFAAAPFSDWRIDGVPAGKIRSVEGGLLTFATIDGAGHMVPYDKPKESLEMLQRWMKGFSL
ncbi:alpha/beta-hydrolase [Fistulina hepatica ATCC 64428]|uniref:Carboxypeptidase n=1 Tax=Fistulina hepatica ATCC 64428 TaxID=1128425 RepID=A0A0D7AAF9_9AGAR|nr:alpha/beta-hydrolase [Fistulina hepatica ATCC 64428]